MRAGGADDAGPAAAIDAFFAALAERRLDDLLAFFTAEDDAALYGSEVGEVIIGHAALRNFFTRLLAKPHGPHFSLRNRRLSVRGEVAWFVAEAEVAFGDQVVAPYRVSGVLEKRDGHWLWALFNGSEPLPDR